MKNYWKNFLSNYIKWLNSSYYYSEGGEIKKFKSGQLYGDYMLFAIEHLRLRVDVFVKIASKERSERLMNELICKDSFNKVANKKQSDVISAFKAYILYKSTVKGA